MRGHVDTAEPHGYTAWMYLIDAEARTIRVYEAAVHDRWLPHSLHPLDPHTAAAPSGGRPPAQPEPADHNRNGGEPMTIACRIAEGRVP
ncbi:hypothetical protein ACN27G_29635 [Plantactinospora sp. WMMB334]|uniref:hypothetical protein n=1 Tax=Plantactinospora sp. WMMB334 TaxID=3404119 RepID=UPI003B93F000